MTVTITFKDGTVAVFTNCAGYSNENGIVRFRGTNAGGTTGTWEYHWDLIDNVLIQ